MPSSADRWRRDHNHDNIWETNEYKFKPRLLMQCIRLSLQRPLPVEGTNTTETCIRSTEIPRFQMTPEERLLRREDLFVELEQFKLCLCEIHQPARHCNFHMRHIVRNETILESCLAERQFNGRLQTDTESDTHFACDLVRGRRIVCRQSHVNFNPKQTRFQHVLDCLTNSVQEFQCPVATTASPITATTASAPVQTKVLILSMAIVISLLLGVLGTWLGIFCWRRKKRRKKNRRQVPILLTKPEHGSQPNLYEGDYTEDHIYDVVKSDGSPRGDPVPDLLSRVPSLPPITNRTPRWKLDDADKVSNRSLHGENYEPLLRHQRSPAEDSTVPHIPAELGDRTSSDYLPLLPDRSSREVSMVVNEPPIRFHPYDIVDESVGSEAVDESLTTPKFVDNSENKSPRPGNNYFILEPTAKDRREEPTTNSGEDEEDKMESDSRENKKDKTESDSHDNIEDKTESDSHDNKEDKTESDFRENKLPESGINTSGSKDMDSAYVITKHPSKSNDSTISVLKLDTTGDNDNGESVPDWDGYEVPVVTPPFDIASTFDRIAVSELGEKREKDDIVNV